MSAAQFEEVQKVSPLLAALVIGFIALVIAAVVTWTPEHELRARLPFLFAPFFLALTLFLTLKMRTRVDGGGVHIRTLYVVRRSIPFAEIESAEAVVYRPLRDYGGWGLRVGRKGKAYNMRGSRGVQLRLKNGGAVLIGSQRPDELARIIQTNIGAHTHIGAMS